MPLTVGLPDIPPGTGAPAGSPQRDQPGPGRDLKQIARCAEYFTRITPKYRYLLDERINIIDTNVLLHQTPGGMLSNLYNQLRDMDALEKLVEVFRELGQVPLVTPTSQIVGTQTVYNVLYPNRNLPMETKGETYKLVMKLRESAMMQDGYISSETLRNFDDPEDFIVISTWRSLEDWRAWEANPERQKLQEELDSYALRATEHVACYNT